MLRIEVDRARRPVDPGEPGPPACEVDPFTAQPGRRPLVYFRSGFGELRDKQAELQRELAVWDALAYGEIPPD